MGLRCLPEPRSALHVLTLPSDRFSCRQTACRTLRAQMRAYNRPADRRCRVALASPRAPSTWRSRMSATAGSSAGRSPIFRPAVDARRHVVQLEAARLLDPSERRPVRGRSPRLSRHGRRRPCEALRRRDCAEGPTTRC
jgi:hypothetical protein